VQHSALTPVGAHQKNASISSGKRCKKRKRNKSSSEEAEVQEQPSPRPPILSKLLLGFNEVTRSLESLSNISGKRLGLFALKSDNGEGNQPPPIAAVFLLRPSDDLVFSHVPTLCYTASLAYPDRQPTRLLVLNPAVEGRIAGALGRSPRVSLLALRESAGVEDGAGTKALLDYVREHVRPVEVPWLREAAEARWLGTKIDSSQMT